MKALHIPSLLSELKLWISGEHVQLIDKARSLGRFFGKQNIPRIGEPANEFMRVIHFEYLSLWSEVKQRMVGIHSIIEAELQSLAKAISHMQNQLSPITHQRALLERELEEYKVVYPLKLFLAYLFAFLVMYLGDTFINGMVFQLFGDNRFFSTLYAFGIVLGLVFGFRQGNKKIGAITDRTVKWVAIFIWIVGITLLFYQFASFRNEYAREIKSFEVSETLIVCCNWLLLLGAEYFMGRLPDWATTKVIFKRAAIIGRIKRLNARESDLVRQKNELEKEQASLNCELLGLNKHQEAFGEFVFSLRNQSLADFLNENAISRTDGQCPTVSDAEYRADRRFFNLGFSILLMVLLLPGIAMAQPTIDIALGVDITDSVYPPPDLTELKRFLDLDEAPSQGIRVKYGLITDMEFTPWYSYELNEVSWLYNSLKRRSECQALARHIEHVPLLCKEKGLGRTHSVIYRQLARMLNELASSEAPVRIAIIYSDMQEKTDWTQGGINFYDPATLALIQSDPSKVERMLSKQVPLVSLKGIHVIIVFQPRSHVEDERFSVVAPFYASFLKRHGAIVHVQTRLSLSAIQKEKP